jgi:hypothetical protein
VAQSGECCTYDFNAWSIFRSSTVYLFSVLMKQFAAYIVSLIVLIITSLFILDAIYTYAFTNGVPRSKLQYILQLEKVEYDYVFFGSSRTEFHIDCALVEELTGKSCVNFGILGTTLLDTFVMIELMEARGIKINNAFVQVDYMFNTTGFSPNFRAGLLPFSNDPKINEILEHYDKSFLDKYLPFYRYLKNDHVIGFREVFNLITGRKAKIDFENGFFPKVGKGSDRVQSLPAKIIENNPSIDSMKEHFKENGINAYFFVAPICNTVLHREYIDKLKLKISSLHNYVSTYATQQSYFYACGHLNLQGAQDFTRFLTNDLILYPKQ